MNCAVRMASLINCSWTGLVLSLNSKTSIRTVNCYNQTIPYLTVAWNCQLIEFNGEFDRCHIIGSFPAQKRLSDLGGNLKATTSKAMWKKFESK